MEVTPEQQRIAIRNELIAIQGGDSEEVDLMMEDYDEYVEYMDKVYEQEKRRFDNYDDGIIDDDDH